MAALRGAENERGSAVGGAWGGGVHGGGGGRSCAKRTWMRVLIFKASASGNLEAKRLHKQMCCHCVDSLFLLILLFLKNTIFVSVLASGAPSPPGPPPPMR